MTIARRLPALFLSSLALTAAPALAQQPAASVIAVPPLTTPDDKPTSGETSAAIAWQATQLIATDLHSTAELVPLGPSEKDYYSYPEVTAPTFSKWRSAGAKALITGFVQARSDGRLTFGCYVYDVQKGREIDRKGFVVAPAEWRRAAHKCSGLAYSAVTGAPAMFDTRIAYVAESGVGDARIKRVAVMDGDGFNHLYVTHGDTIVVTPRMSPKGSSVAFVSFIGGKPQVRIADLTSGAQRPLVANDAMSFAPRYSPDGSRIVFSMMLGANSDIYVVDANGGIPRRLTSSPGADTDASFSPDGGKIAFESDRSGTQQIYVMNADGSDQRRISFGGGWYASPEWSPAGDRIAFTRRLSGGLRIGAMNPDGAEERLLTNGPSDEGPSWAANGRDILFQRTDAAGRPALYRVSMAGGEPRKVVTPQDGSDPDWSGLMD